jgi:hypothetical protein
MQPLPEDQVLPLPWAGAIVTGPGVRTAWHAIRTARQAGAGDSRGWEDATAAVSTELDAAVAAGARPQVLRPLRRLVANLEAEARAAADHARP